MTECHRRILPVFNRMVAFAVTDWSFHGHPEPLNCPEDRSRKSMPYYFTVDRPRGEVLEGKRSTLFVKRPDEVVPKARCSTATDRPASGASRRRLAGR